MLTIRSRAVMFTFIGSVSLMLLSLACSEETASSPPAPETDAAVTPPPPPDANVPDVERKLTITNIVSFDANAFELPEALSYRDGFAYVSVAPRAQILKVAVNGGARSVYATLPIQQSNFVLGSTFDTAGNLFVGVGATNPGDAAGVAAAGIYRIPAGGGTPALFASSATGLKFGNGLAFDAAGNLFVSDAAQGAIYKFSSAGAVGTATPWKTDALLTGDQAACPGVVAGFPIGANGIVVDQEGVFVGNTDRGALVKIAVNGDGSAGAATNVVTDCARLEGLDGLRVDPTNASAFLGTNNPKNTLVRITRAGQVSVVHQGAPPDLDGPADLVHVTGTTNPVELLVVNSAFPEAFAPPDAGLVPRPSLVKVTLP